MLMVEILFENLRLKGQTFTMIRAEKLLIIFKMNLFYHLFLRNAFKLPRKILKTCFILTENFGNLTNQSMNLYTFLSYDRKA